MPTVSADQIINTLWGMIQAIPGIVSLGIPGYILLGLTVLGFGIFAIWLKKKAAEQALAQSQAQDQKDQADNKTGNTDISNTWDQAHSNIEDIRKENPDDGKKKR